MCSRKRNPSILIDFALGQYGVRLGKYLLETVVIDCVCLGQRHGADDNEQDFVDGGLVEKNRFSDKVSTIYLPLLEFDRQVR